MIFFHPYREKYEFRRFFFIRGAEDVTLVNKNNSLLTMKRWIDPHMYPLRTVSCFVHSYYQKRVFFYNLDSSTTNDWGLGFLLPKAREEPGHGAAKVQGSIQEELTLGPTEWCCHIDQKIGEVCKMHLSWLKALYIHRIVLMWLGVVPIQSMKCPFWKRSYCLL